MSQEVVTPQSEAVPNLPGSAGNTSTGPSDGQRNPNSRSNLVNAVIEEFKPKTPQRDDSGSTPAPASARQEPDGSIVEPPKDEGDPATTPATPALTPEETQRREEQSFKDKYYALELERTKEKAEREAYQEQQRLAQFDRQEQQAYAGFQQQVKPSEDLAWELHAEANEARELGDYETASKLDRRVATINGQVQAQYRQFNQFVAGNRQQAHLERTRQQETQITRLLSKVDLSLDDLKAHNPKLNTTNYLDVLEAVAKAAGGKEAAKYKSQVEKAKVEADEAKKKWRTDSPAAVVDRPVTTGANGTPGKLTARQQIAQGIKEETARRSQ